MAPPTEATLLANFLLPAAPLPSLLSLKQFTALFSGSQQSSPEIKALYRDLQAQRARVTDAVSRNIVDETKRGTHQRMAVIRAKRRGESSVGHGDDEAEVEESLFGPSSNLPKPNPHPLKSIVPEIEQACEDMESELRALEGERQILLEEMRRVVGGFSDLRYGKLANPELGEQIIDGCKRLETACERI